MARCICQRYQFQYSYIKFGIDTGIEGAAVLAVLLEQITGGTWVCYEREETVNVVYVVCKGLKVICAISAFAQENCLRKTECVCACARLR